MHPAFIILRIHSNDTFFFISSGTQHKCNMLLHEAVYIFFLQRAMLILGEMKKVDIAGSCRNIGRCKLWCDL